MKNNTKNIEVGDLFAYMIDETVAYVALRIEDDVARQAKDLMVDPDDVVGTIVFLYYYKGQQKFVGSATPVLFDFWSEDYIVKL